MVSKLLISFFLVFGIVGVAFADSGQCIYQDKDECHSDADQITWVVNSVTVTDKCVRKDGVGVSTCTSADVRMFSVPVGKMFCPITQHAVVINTLAAASEECVLTPMWDMDGNGSFETEWHINGTSEGLHVGPNSGFDAKGEIAGLAGNIRNNVCAPAGALMQIEITDVDTGSSLDCTDLGGVFGGIYGEYR